MMYQVQAAIEEYSPKFGNIKTLVRVRKTDLASKLGQCGTYDSILNLIEEKCCTLVLKCCSL